MTGGDDRPHEAEDDVLRRQREANEHLVLHALDSDEKREQADAARQAAERDRARLFEHAGWGVAIIDTPGCTLTAVNPAFARMHGYTVEELIGKQLELLVAPEGLSAFAAEIERTHRQGQHGFQGLHQRKDGSRFPCLTEAMATRDASGALVASAYNFQDISARLDLESRFAVSERLAALGTLAAGIAHEINNPLAYNLGNLAHALELLPTLIVELHGALGTDARWPSIDSKCQGLRAALWEAQEGADRVARIVADMKTLSLPHARGPEVLPLSRILDSAIRMTSATLKHRVQIVPLFGPAPPVSCDEGKLGQVFVNLILNAAQSIQQDGRAHRIRLELTTAADGWALASVIDDGCGIAPDVLPRIFDPFFTTKAVGVGSGLGLSICHSIVVAHGGEIGVDSVVGSGSTFWVRLPAAALAPVGPVGVPSLGSPGRAARILVIDDEPGVGRALKRLLSPPHDLLVLSSAVEAKLLLDADAAFDVVLCDLMMPHVTGIQLHDWVLAHHPSVAERMLFMSGGAFTPEAKTFLARMDQRYVPKPFVLADLRARIAELLQRRAPISSPDLG